MGTVSVPPQNSPVFYLFWKILIKFIRIAFSDPLSAANMVLPKISDSTIITPYSRYSDCGLQNT